MLLGWLLLGWVFFDGVFFFPQSCFPWICSGSILRSGDGVFKKIICSIIFLVWWWMDGRGSEKPLQPCLLLVRLRQRLGCDWDATVTWASIASIESNAKTQPGYVTLSVPSTLVLLYIYWQN